MASSNLTIPYFLFFESCSEIAIPKVYTQTMIIIIMLIIMIPIIILQ